MLKTQPVSQALVSVNHDFQVDVKREVIPVPSLSQSLAQSKKSQIVEAVFIDTAGPREGVRSSNSSDSWDKPLGPNHLSKNYLT